MKRFIALTALLTPTVYASSSAGLDAPSLSEAVDAARRIVQGWHESASGVDKELQFFHSSLPQKGSSTKLPESKNGDAVIVCDRGLLFDAKTSRLVYVGNVRMRDTRLTLHARDNLYLHLDALSSNSEDEKPNKQASQEPGTSTTNSTPATSVKEIRSETTNSHKSAPPATKTTGIKTVAEKQDAADIPLHIETGSAEANVVDNRIILFSPAGADPIILTRGEDVLSATTSSDTSARILADASGNILIEGNDIDISYTDSENGKATISTQGGLVYYHAATNSLHLCGNTELTHPDGTLNCTESLCLEFDRDENAAPVKPGFLSQFIGMRLSGVRAATASGDVVVKTNGVNGGLPGTARGDKLVYNGISGNCSITGEDSKLTYGAHNSIYANEGIRLLPNGDIELRGSNIHGTYERLSQRDGAPPVQGTFKANGNILFTAETGIISTDRGLTASDEELDFSCTGAVKLLLAQNPNTKITEQKKGIPNLAIAQYSDIITATAAGQVRAKRRIGGALASQMEGEHAVINLKNGSAILTGGETTPAVFEHDKNRVVATAGDTPAVLDIMENGDISLTGKDITIRLQGKNGLTTATGHHSMRLFRAENRIESGSGVSITSPSAIITTNGIFSAILQPSDNTEETSSHAFARHSFNYEGVKSAETAEGGTVRTEKGSMQCTGYIHVTMNPTAGPEHEMGGVQQAIANGNVMLLTKDSTNRMIRAKGDRLTVNGNTGMKSLTGREVILENEYDRHIVSGKGAAVHVDRKNNVRISGEKHETQVTRLNEQATKHKQNNSTHKKK